MASVTITVGDISVGYEDEDRGAKALNRVALRTIETLVNTLTKSDDEDDEELEVLPPAESYFCGSCKATVLYANRLEHLGGCVTNG